MDNKLKRLKELRDDLNMTQSEMASFIGLKWYQLKNIETGKTKLSNQLIKHLEWQFRVDPLWLLEGKGEMYIDGKRPTIKDGNKIRERGPATKKPSVVDAGLDGMAKIRFYDVKAAAGGGVVIGDEEAPDFIGFRREFIEKVLCMNPNDLFIVTVTGDSMYPTLQERDLIICNQAQVTPRVDNIYLVRFDDTLNVKRLQFLPDGMVKVVSDNKQYDPFSVRIDDIKIMGRVVWFGRKML